MFVEALREIGAQLKKTDWNFSVDPCSNESSWTTLIPTELKPYGFNNSITCNCSNHDGVCHVVELFLKGQDLTGVLPPALVKLPYLKTVEFIRNCLSGTIPHEWASSTTLERLDISMNNISGAIPSFLGNITTLKNLFMSNNLLSGTVPHELGKLVNLENLVLSANYLTGELPINLTNLIKLTELFSSNNFTGRMPSFFQSWKQLKQLEIEASGFEGPIPSSISILSNLTELRISDLVGEGSKFPNLSSMTGMIRLMLRSCNISGPIPPYISNMTQLQILDLSFNQLDGTVPNFDGLESLTYMYLTSNLLTGAIPDWIKNRDDKYQIDLSYNNFSESSAPPCRETLNLFKSSSGRDNLILHECLNTPCSNDRYSLHINCGGKATIVGNIQYEEDEDSAAILSNLFFSVYNTGGVLGINIFNKLGEKLVWKDFDIEISARGVDKAVVVEYKANVTNRNLMIRFYWAGKGTTFTPKRAIFGPLISAISVESDFVLPDHEDGTMKIFIVVGAIVLVLLLIFMILGILWWKGCLGRRIPRENELKGLDLQTGFFTYRQIKAATSNFNVANKIGEGGFGSVYKGVLSDALHMLCLVMVSRMAS
nr:putative lrr receptor-like serine/threonine-protein kinase [Quercus suber]